LWTNSAQLFEEIDYLNEGQRRKFVLNFTGEPSVKVPAIYWFYTSTCPNPEWINGFKLTDTQSIREAVSKPMPDPSVQGSTATVEHGFSMLTPIRQFVCHG